MNYFQVSVIQDDTLATEYTDIWNYHCLKLFMCKWTEKIKQEPTDLVLMDKNHALSQDANKNQ